MALIKDMLTAIQIGKETTRGDAVPATRYVPHNQGASFERQIAYEEFTGLRTGTLARARQRPLVTRRGSQLVVPQPFSFENILWPLLSGVRGGVTPVTPSGGTKTRTWTFTPSMTADPTIDTYTVEWSEAAPPGYLTYEFPYAFCSEFTINMPGEGAIELSSTFMGRRSTKVTRTGGLAVPDEEYAPAGSVEFYDDPTWGALGTTQVSGQVYELSATWSDFLVPKFYKDGRGDLDFSRVEYKAGRMLAVTGQMVLDTAATSWLQVSQDRKDDGGRGVKRAGRIRINGPEIETGHNHHMDIDFVYVHGADSVSSFSDEVDGQRMVAFNLMSIDNAATTPNDVQFTVQNGLAAFPA